MKKAFLFILAALALCSCAQKSEKTSKSLILYYSQTDYTRQVANLLQVKTGADIDSIVPVQAYDGDFSQTISRCQNEFANNEVPKIKPLSRKIADYDTIYIGYPVWFGTYAQPIAGLVQAENFAGKVIIPFCTFGSGGLNTSSDKLKAALPHSTFLPGYGIRSARVSDAASSELDEFLIRAGIRSGEVEMLPDYSEPHAVSKEEAAIFDAACGSYPMPLGKPVTVASRVTSTSTQYVFETESKNPNSAPAKAHIYVTVGKAEGAAPEFIEAVR